MRRHDALLSALRLGADVALAPEALGSRGMTSFVAATAARASCVPRAARPALPHDRHLSRSLSPAHRRWYATGRAGASGSFAVPHPTRADTLRYPARAAGAAAALDPKLKGAMVGRPDPLASRGEGGPGGARATAFDRLVYYPILFLAAVELLVWYSVAATSPPSEQRLFTCLFPPLRCLLLAALHAAVRWPSPAPPARVPGALADGTRVHALVCLARPPSAPSVARQVCGGLAEPRLPARRLSLCMAPASALLSLPLPRRLRPRGTRRRLG